MFHYFMFFPAKKKESNKTCLLPYLFGAVSQLSERLSLGLLFSTRPLNKIETPSHTAHVFYLTQPISILKFTDSYSKAGTCAYYEDSFYLNLSLSIAWFLYLPSSECICHRGRIFSPSFLHLFCSQHQGLYQAWGTQCHSICQWIPCSRPFSLYLFMH